MDKAKIDTKELFSLMVLFELGSAIVVGLGMKAKQDAWLAILLGMIGGVFLAVLYFYLYKKNCNLSLTSLCRRVLGKHIGAFIGVIYISYFTYLAGRILRDFGELLVSTAIRGTPISVIEILMMLSISYGCYLGVEVVGRAGEIFFIVFMFLGTAFFIIMFASGVIESNNFFPVLEEGVKPVLTTAFPLTLTFPFGEIIAFIMLFPYLNESKKVGKTVIFAVLFSGIILTAVIAINIGTLGAAMAANSTFPLLKALEKVSFGHYFQRMDPIAILMLIIGGYFKILIFMYASLMGIKDVFSVKDYRKFIIPLCFIIIILSIIMARNFTEHLEIGLKLVPKYVHIPLQVGIPVLLGAATYIKGKKEGRNSNVK